MSRDGEPWFPVTGEIHFSRIAPEHWSDVLGLARSGGLTSVASYVFWRHHEPRLGEFDWSGARDLRRFVRLAAAHGLDVVVRLGPWSHGEMRHGGFPDWLVDSGIPLRQDHPEYLRLVRRLYGRSSPSWRG
ncbi:beta-galactosidase [Nesterenkonia sp. PF2B19]|uniref:beta-galactosidase n=1 Tax=Nesterenkonia sp. PF2B19 TaxID=1881858 RepID=UPI0023512165|nr:beta-galactosidase [Nesterenkonia sp. PF2B19]